MPPDPNTIEVNITARSAEYVAAMKQAASTTSEASKEMRAELAEIGSGAEAAVEPVHSFAGVIKEYRQEIRTEGRYSRFLAADIASMGIASKGAAAEVTSLVAAFAFGGGMGIAIEGVKMLVKSINEASEAAEQQAEALKKIHEGVAESIKKSMEEVRKTFEQDNRTETEKAWAAEVAKGRDQLKKIDEQINKILAHSGGMRDFFHALTTDAKGVSDAFTIEGTEEQIAKLQAQKAAILEEIAKGKPKFEELGAEELAAKAKKDADETALAYAKLRSDELREWKRHYDERTAFATKAVEDIFAAEEKQQLDEAKLRAENLREDKKHYDEVTAVTTAALQERFAAEDRLAKQAAEREKRYQESILHAGEAAAKSMGTAFGDAFTGMIQGTQTVESSIKSMLKATLKAILDVAIASITASAAKAAAEAAASQAGIPIVGPALAVGAMAAMEALVMGLIDSLPSAAGGYDIPTSVNPVIQAHGGEMVLPRDIAEPLRANLGAGAGGGNDHVHVHIHDAIDGDSVRRVVKSDQFIRAVREARREGRMP